MKTPQPTFVSVKKLSIFNVIQIQRRRLQQAVLFVYFFLAVHNSSIGDHVPCLVRLLVGPAPLTIRVFTTLQSVVQSDPRDLWPLRHLIRVIRKHDLTNISTFFLTILTILTIVDIFWQFSTNLTILTILTILDNFDIFLEFWQFWTILIIFNNVGDVLQFWSFSTILTISDNFDNFRQS